VRTEGVDEALLDVRELTQSRERAAHAPGRGDRGLGLGLGGGAVVASLGLALAGPAPTGAQWLVLALLVALYALAFRTEIELAGGSAVPTQPMLVGLLLAAPPTLAPLAVLLAVHAADVRVLRAPGQTALDRSLGVVVRSAAAWSCLAPAAVLHLAAPGPVSLDRWPLYAVALLGQFGLDAAVGLARAASLGVAPRKVLPSLAWTFGVDTLLAAVGLCVVVAADGAPAALVVLAAPAALVRLMADDRSRHLHTAVALGEAFDAARVQARVDPLTGLANRRAWDEAVGALAADAGQGVVVLVADLDGLKRVNDVRGHGAGDDLIRAMADVLRATLPAGAVAARLGGDEFGALVPVPPGHRRTAGAGLVGAVRRAVAAHPGVGGLPLSCSIGWAATAPGEDLAAAVERADRLAGEDKVLRRTGREHAPSVV
jgi:diguanylate cyclase (GGDEF)-like protein